MSANPSVRPILETLPEVPGAAATAGPPTPQQMLALLQRAAAECNEVRDRLLILTRDLDVAAAHLDQHFGARAGAHLAAVADVAPAPVAAPAPTPPDPMSPAMLAAVEMAVAGFCRDEVHARMSNKFSIADPTPILDDVFGPG